MFPKAKNLLTQAGITERDKDIVKTYYDPETVGVVRHRFSSHQTMYRRLGKLCDRGLLYNLDKPLPSNGKGRGENVYSTWNTKNSVHEVRLSRVLRAWGIKALREPDVGPLNPDAEAGRLCVEMDCDTQDWPSVIKQLSAYMDTDKVVVFVTVSEWRRNGVLQRADFLSNSLLACTLEEAMEGVGLDTDGKRWALKKVFQKVLNRVYRRSA